MKIRYGGNRECSAPSNGPIVLNEGKADPGLLHFFEIQGFSGGQLLTEIIYLQAKDGILLYTKNYFFLIESGTTIIYIKDRP